MTGTSPTGPTPFRPPAHKHAHHLHSIPPREKSTRTLIIDHLLWVHARTRFAQARAELGMTDRTGGASAPNFSHRERPENYEEEEEAQSEGEDIFSLVARAGGPGHTHEEDDDERLESQDLTLARSLRQRAESVEKVIASMLDQPPEVPPVHPDDMDPPTSPQLHAANAQRHHQHTLPNGVRLRLAFGTVINDLFARRAPNPPHRLYIGHSPGAPLPALPSALIPLAAVSLVNCPAPSRKPMPSAYIRALYATGADPDAQNSPPSLRCPRHLHMGCEICVEAKISRPAPKAQRTGSNRAGSTNGSSPGDINTPNNPNGSNVFMVGGGVTGWQEGSGIGSGLSRPGKKGTVLRRPSDAYNHTPAPGSLQPMGAPAEDAPQAMANTKLAELVSRFLRLSALVATELGREATEDRASVDGNGRDDEPSSSSGPRPSSPIATFKSPQRQTSDPVNLYGNAFRPSREWYFLLSGILTRTVLEGYITGNWLGVEPLEVLLTVGLGFSPVPDGLIPSETPSNNDSTPGLNGGKSRSRDEFAEFDPDDLPDLEDSIRILFPALKDISLLSGTYAYPRREGAELEYEIEMTERMGRFYDIPSSTPDVATHMEDLAWQFPAEAVERAACRFCEAVARWRGKPELETYKNASWITNGRNPPPSAAPSGAMPMSIDSLVNSSPQRKPSVDKYFTPPPSLMMQGRKRRRSDVER